MRIPTVLAPLVALACQASVQGDANVSSQSGADADLEAQLQAERAAAPGGGAARANATAPTAEHGVALLGARRDLTLASGQGSSKCSCLRVALGGPDAEAFRWKKKPPTIDPRTQLIIGLSSEGGGCTDPKGSTGASYWGYQRTGDNIIVYVENGVQGRPIVAGGVIPKPFGAGQVYVGPIKGSAYGKATEGKGNCKVGNPGAPRTAPVSPTEDGESPESAPEAG